MMFIIGVLTGFVLRIVCKLIQEKISSKRIVIIEDY